MISSEEWKHASEQVVVNRGRGRRPRNPADDEQIEGQIDIFEAIEEIEDEQQ